MFGFEKLKKIEYLEKEVYKLTKELRGRSTTDEVAEIREKLVKDVSELEAENKKLARIIKYSKDIPTYNIESHATLTHSVGWPAIITKYYLYVYIDKEEYIIDLQKLESDNYNVRCFEVADNLVTLELEYDWTDTICIDKYIVDYKKGTYVHSRREITKESGNKRCLDLERLKN